MRLYLAQSFPNGWGGVERTSEAMKIHLAERDPQHHSWPKNGADENNMKLRILLSYHYYKDIDLDALFSKYFTEPYPDVFIDSGGFSAMTQGVEIDIDAYIAYVKQYKHLITTYANLDAVGDAVTTLRNQKTMEGAGVQPIPVFHVGEPWEYLEDYIEQYSYIALGGMVPHMRFPKRIIPWMLQCFKRAEGKAVFHGFGATSWEVVKALPWYSVDSSSWGQGFRFGQVPLFDEHKGKFEKASLGNGKECLKYKPLFDRLGFDWMDFADRERNDRAKICAVSALSYMKAEQWLRKRHGEIFIPNRQGEDSVLNLHLADANPQRFGDAVTGAAGLRLHLSDTSSGINFGDADAGVKVFGAAAAGSVGNRMSLPQKSEAMTSQSGLNLFLAEHSLDRGGVGDTSRAMEILSL